MSDEKLSEKEWHVLEHSTAWPKCYRNHFCASEGHHDWEALQSLCKRGLMCVSRKPGELSGGDTVFIVTVDGFAALEVGRRGPIKK